MRRSGHGTGGRGASALEDANDLEQRLSEVTENLRGGYFTATSDLEARISELERTTLDNKGGMNVLFKSGLKNESDDKAFAYQFYGRIQNDWVFWDANRDIESALGAEINGGEEFRRVRLGANGTLYGNVKFKSEIDFAAGAVAYADVFMELTGCGFGNVRVGHFDEPFGLDRLTSSRFITFMERNLIEQSGMTPERNTGIHGPRQRRGRSPLVYQLGVFRDANGARATTSGGTPRWGATTSPAASPAARSSRTTARRTCTSASRVQHPRLQQRRGPVPRRPNIHIGRGSSITGTLSDITDGTALGSRGRVRGRARHGEGRVPPRSPATATTARMTSTPDVPRGRLAYWLTGENTGYDKSKGSWSRSMPKHNFGDGDGQGAWRVALRYDTIDLDDGSVTGGEADQWTFGVSWLLSPNTGVHLNWARYSPDDAANALDTVSVIGLRFEIDF